MTTKHGLSAPANPACESMVAPIGLALEVIVPANTTAAVTQPDGAVHHVEAGTYQWQAGEVVTA